MSHADRLAPSAHVDRRALRKSLLLHVGVLGLILLLPYLHTPPRVEPPRVVEAVLVRAAPPAQPVIEPPTLPIEIPRPEPVKKVEVPEPVKPLPKIPLPAPKPVPVPKPALPKPLPEKTVAKPAPAKPLPPKPIIKKPTLDSSDFDAEMKTLEKEAQQAELERVQKAVEKSMAAARSTANQAIVNKYTALIRLRTETKWNRPLSARHGMVTTLRINTLPGGEVTNVITIKSSGDAAFDASAEEAIRKASPLPVPDDLAVYNESFRVFRFNFNFMEDQ